MKKNRVQKIIYALKNPRLVALHFLSDKFWRKMDDESFLKFQYKAWTKKTLHLNPPKTFNEKIQWLKLYDRKLVYTKLVDKYEVRKVIQEKLGEEYLVPLLGVWEKSDEIDFSKLPEQFVLKPTHTSGNVYICRDKSKIDENKIRNMLDQWLKREYFWGNREWPYKNIKPRLIAEEMIDSNIVDYKFYCFNGEPKMLYLSQGLEDHSTASISFFDMNLKKLPFGRSDYRPFTTEVEKPKNFDEMVRIATKLSKGFSFVRIDLYSVKNKVYFSEYTLHPCAGYMPFDPEEYDLKLGEMLHLENEVTK